MAEFYRQSRSHNDGKATAYHTVRAQDAQRKVGNMHRAAFALAISRLAAYEFCDHLLQVPALGDDVTVSPMGGGHKVIRSKYGANPH
jgi:hypothetical protein